MNNHIVLRSCTVPLTLCFSDPRLRFLFHGIGIPHRNGLILWTCDVYIFAPHLPSRFRTHHALKPWLRFCSCGLLSLLLDQHDTIKICDFGEYFYFMHIFIRVNRDALSHLNNLPYMCCPGLARMIGDGCVSMTGLRGTPAYMAPSVFL